MGAPGEFEDKGLVLAGAVAKGAFEIGAAQVLARRPRRITRVAATSSGALNAAILGTGLAFDQFSAAAEFPGPVFPDTRWRRSVRRWRGREQRAYLVLARR
jgi:predicted acylesterase/phospholipase RssA